MSGLMTSGILRGGCGLSSLKWVESSSGRRLVSLKAIPSSSKGSDESFWNKNQRLNRPISPHLTIYKPQLTSMLSISHRGTGVYLSALLAGGALLPALLDTSVPVFLQSLEPSSPLLFSVKFAIVAPFFYHTFNGIRHLFWDIGRGLRIPEVYKSGLFVLVLTLISSIVVSAY